MPPIRSRLPPTLHAHKSQVFMASQRLRRAMYRHLSGESKQSRLPSFSMTSNSTRISIARATEMSLSGPGGRASSRARGSGSHATCTGLSPVKGLFALAGQLICDCSLGFADSSLFGAEKAVLRSLIAPQVSRRFCPLPA